MRANVAFDSNFEILASIFSIHIPKRKLKISKFFSEWVGERPGNWKKLKLVCFNMIVSTFCYRWHVLQKKTKGWSNTLPPIRIYMHPTRFTSKYMPAILDNTYFYSTHINRDESHLIEKSFLETAIFYLDSSYIFFLIVATSLMFPQHVSPTLLCLRRGDWAWLRIR